MPASTTPRREAEEAEQHRREAMMTPSVLDALADADLPPEITDHLHELVEALVVATRQAPEEVSWAVLRFDSEQLGRFLLDGLPRSSGAERWDELIGPFVTWRGAAARVEGVRSRQGVDQRRRHHRLLGCQTGDGSWFYPVWQFAAGDVLSGLPQVLEELLPVVDGWTAALWLRTPNRLLGDVEPASWLAESRPLEPVVTAARRQAREWRGEQDAASVPA